MITVSIVSHGHGVMVENLVDQLDIFDEIKQVIVIHNTPEEKSCSDSSKLYVINNKQKKGFAANHNAAFKYCTQPYFCILNPDILIAKNPFPSLLSILDREKEIALITSLILSPKGDIEDSVRYFPTVKRLVMKAIFGQKGDYKLEQGEEVLFPDWVAGMFMLFRTPCFSKLGGFDEKYYLYYEDVDICARLQTDDSNRKVAVDLSTSVIHDARRNSRSNLFYMWWHFKSMLRYLWKYRSHQAK